MAVPLSIAAPAAAASLAYLNARLSVFYDWFLIRSLISVGVKQSLAERRDRVNLFYVLESYALSGSTATHPFIIYQGRQWTYKEAYDMILKHGRWLKNKYGVDKGEIVAIDFMNCPMFIWLWLGLWSIGATPAFINYNLTGKPLTHCLKTSTARLVFVDPEIRFHFSIQVEEEIRDPSFTDGKGPLHVVIFSSDLEREVLATDPVREPDAVRSGSLSHDAACLMYTSGTTGLPKPAVVSWAKIARGGRFTSLFTNMKRQDIFYTAMPLYHSSASSLGLGTVLTTGATLALGHKFSTRTFWDEVRASKATMIQYVGETLRYLLAAPPSPLDKFHNVHTAFGNGLRSDVWDRFKARFGIETIAEFYGATEGVSALWNLSRNSLSTGAIGRNGAINNILLRFKSAVVELDTAFEAPARDPGTGFCRRVKMGAPGELLYKLDPAAIHTTFQGYLNNQSAGEKKILRDVFQKGDAWFRTGDAVRTTKDGLWYFVDRLGDTFRWKSENVSTAEVSEVLGMHDAVEEACVYGVEVPGQNGRAGCAALILKAGFSQQNRSEISDAVLKSLADHASSQLPRYAVPVFLRITSSLQNTGTNKQQKHVLRGQSVEHEKIPEGDRLFWFQGGTYKSFRKRDWAEIKAGRARL